MRNLNTLFDKVQEKKNMNILSFRRQTNSNMPQIFNLQGYNRPEIKTFRKWVLEMCVDHCK